MNQEFRTRIDHLIAQGMKGKPAEGNEKELHPMAIELFDKAEELGFAGAFVAIDTGNGLFVCGALGGRTTVRLLHRMMENIPPDLRKKVLSDLAMGVLVGDFLAQQPESEPEPKA